MCCLKCPCCNLGSLLGMGNEVPNKGIIMVNESDLQSWNSVVVNATLLEFFMKSWVVMESCDSSTTPNHRFSTRMSQHCLPLSVPYKRLPYTTTKPLCEQMPNSKFSCNFMHFFPHVITIRLSEEEGKRKKAPFYWVSNLCQAMGLVAYTKVS